MQLTNLPIPNGWRLSTVGESCEIHNHLREPISSLERKALQGTYPYYGPTGILDYLDHYRVEGMYALIGEDGDHFLKYESRDMTLLVSGKFNVNNHAHLLVGKDGCTTEWVFNFFRRANLYNYITRQGAGRFKLNKAALEKLPILLPPLAEQRKIAAILGAWDAAITTVEQLIAALQARKQGLMQRLLTGAVRFPEFAGIEWETIRLGKLTSKIGSGVTPKGGSSTYLSAGIPLIRSQNVLVGELDLSDVAFISTEQHDSMASTKLRQFDVLLNITGASIGRSSVFPKSVGEANVNQHVCIIRTSDKLHPYFLCAFLNSNNGQKLIDSYQAGGNRQGLNFEQIGAFPIPVPPLREQRKIADVLNTSDAEIQLLRREVDSLKRQKQALMQQLLSGQVRVNVAEENVDHELQVHQV